MKALVVNAAGRSFNLEDVDVASPIGSEVLIEVQASGLCHTDLLFAANNIAPFPAVFGYEVSGVVAQIGADVSQLRVGDHVVGSLIQSWIVPAMPDLPSSVSTQKQHRAGRQWLRGVQVRLHQQSRGHVVLTAHSWRREAT